MLRSWPTVQSASSLHSKLLTSSSPALAPPPVCGAGRTSCTITSRGPAASMRRPCAGEANQGVAEGGTQLVRRTCHQERCPARRQPHRHGITGCVAVLARGAWRRARGKRRCGDVPCLRKSLRRTMAEFQLPLRVGATVSFSTRTRPTQRVPHNARRKPGARVRSGAAVGCQNVAPQIRLTAAVHGG